jgi:hypothetical protein
MVDAALAYVGRGWWVFPASSDGQKKSHKAAAFSNGERWGASNDPAVIRRDFRRWPSANIGLVTGPQSKIFVLETDTISGHKVNGAAGLAALEKKHGKLPKTLMAESPSGSPHRYFTYPDGVVIRNSTSEIAPGVDLRGLGGMVLAPPSLRPGVGTYRWLNNNPIADAPRWLIALCQDKDDGRRHKPNKTLMTDDLDELAYAVSVIPNNLEYDAWKNFGLALYGATGGDDYGFELFDLFSRRWVGGDYNEFETRLAWKQISSSPPREIGTGSIYHQATQADPSWRKVYETRKWQKFINSLTIR